LIKPVVIFASVKADFMINYKSELQMFDLSLS